MTQYRNRYTGRYYLRYLIFYTVMFFLTAWGVFRAFAEESRSMVWAQDAVGQYFPQVVYFIRETREFVKNLLQGKFIFHMYDLTRGLGDMIAPWLEPTSWFYLLFRPEEAEQAFGFVMLLRFYLAGLSMSVFALYFRQGQVAAMVSSFVYIFSSIGLCVGMRHSKFIVPMIFFPLCILCVEEIYREKRWYLCTVAVWFHLWYGYYFLYMTTIAMGLYFLIRFFLDDRERTGRNFFRRGSMLAGSYLLGVLIGNINLVTTFSAYLHSSRTGAVSDWRVRLFDYGEEWISNLLRCFLVPGRTPGFWMWLGFIPLAYLGIIVLFLKKGRKELKILFLLETVCCFLPVAAFVFSGFSSVTNRWIYIYAFTVAAVLGFVWEDLLSLGKKEILLLLVGMIPYLLVAFPEMKKEAVYSRGTVQAAALLAVSFGVILFVNLAGKRWKRSAANGILAVLVVLSFWHSGYVTYDTDMFSEVEDYTEKGKTLETITDFPLSVVSELEDDTFYRCAAKGTGMNVQGASMILDYYGTVYYSSTVNGAIQDFYRKMGLISWNLIQMKGFDGRAFLDTLASVKYFGIKKKNTQELPYGYTLDSDYKKYALYKNEMFLPLGYTYDRVISQEDMMAYDVAARGEVLMQAAVLEGEEGTGAETDDQSEQPDEKSGAIGTVPESGESIISVTGQYAEITEISTQDVDLGEHTMKVLKDDDQSQILIEFEGMENSEIYLSIQGLQNEDTDHLFLNFRCGDYKNSYKLCSPSDTYYTGQEDFLFNLGYHKDRVNSCLITFENKGELSFDKIRIYCQPMENMENYVEKLREGSMEDVEILPNAVKGNVEVSEEKLLVVTIPYQAGWTAYVDGKKTEIQKANLMYLGISLEPGRHTIELRYRMPGLTVSLMVSAAGLAIFVLLLVRRRRRRPGGQLHV